MDQLPSPPREYDRLFHAAGIVLTTAMDIDNRVYGAESVLGIRRFLASIVMEVALDLPANDFDTDAPRLPAVYELTARQVILLMHDVQTYCRRHFPKDQRKNASPPAKDSIPRPVVILQGRTLPALVGGKPKKLNSARYDVIEALASARPHGLTKDGIEKVRTDARGILTRLRNDPDWEKVIHMAGVSSGRYRIE